MPFIIILPGIIYHLLQCVEHGSEGHIDQVRFPLREQYIRGELLADRLLLLTLTLPGPSAGVSGSLDSYCSLKPLCSGMGEVVPARNSPTLLPPSPRTVLSLSYFKVLQCINCRE